MNNSSLTSRICLSLKSIDKVDFADISCKINNIELRLDSIKISEINLNYFASLFNIIILKINNLEQILEVNQAYHNNLLTNKIIYDIDNQIFNKDYKKYVKILIKNKYIISYHNIKYDDLLFMLSLNILSNKTSLNKYIKIVLIDNGINYQRNILSKIYNYHNINRFKLICFFEGKNLQQTRYQSIMLGGPFLYCCINKEMKTGNGQPTLEEAYRMTRLLGRFCKDNESKN